MVHHRRVSPLLLKIPKTVAIKPSSLLPTLLAVQEDSKQSKNVRQTGFEKETRPGEEVKYEGYSNPSKQSRSFRLLESNLGEAEVSSVTGNTRRTAKTHHQHNI